MHNDHENAEFWYIAQLRPNGLNMALRNLERQRFGIFNPTISVSTPRSGRFQQRKEQLFPGYLFVSLSSEGVSWRKINNTRGISRILTFGDRPAFVPQTLILNLKNRCDEEGELLPPEEVSVGDAVRVISGPFADFTAMVHSIDRERRIWVLLDILGRETRVAMRRQDLQCA
ncbi:transcription termination/antitermination protein NusG [Celeribacter halophilus]|jgi:transcriptional antiterminator RfaH|uniref:transcription termination/antitermination protein NusG n=1 Tax=Celeribacter halophilus TaxID=576117 RepID=UPI003A8E7F09